MYSGDIEPFIFCECTDLFHELFWADTAVHGIKFCKDKKSYYFVRYMIKCLSNKNLYELMRIANGHDVGKDDIIDLVRDDDGDWTLIYEDYTRSIDE